MREALTLPRRDRATAVIYRPRTERRGDYFEAVLPDQFDAFVWFVETRAVTPLDANAEPSATDPLPFGF